MPSPWERALQVERFARAALRGYPSAELGRHVRVRVGRRDSLAVGRRAVIGSGTKIDVFGVGQPAQMRIGERVVIGDRCVFTAALSVEIGDGTGIAWDCQILDSDFHTLAYRSGAVSQPTQPVRIGRGVWIGANSMILKGVTIGDGAVIGAGSVVRTDVPANALALGNPARVITTLDDGRQSAATSPTVF